MGRGRHRLTEIEKPGHHFHCELHCLGKSAASSMFAFHFHRNVSLSEAALKNERRSTCSIRPLLARAPECLHLMPQFAFAYCEGHKSHLRPDHGTETRAKFLHSVMIYTSL